MLLRCIVILAVTFLGWAIVSRVRVLRWSVIGSVHIIHCFLGLLAFALLSLIDYPQRLEVSLALGIGLAPLIGQFFLRTRE
jgi:hypothetical protein